MQQYFISESPREHFVTVTDKDTLKHMFQVMRLDKDDEVLLVIDGIKYLSLVVDKERHQFELLQALEDNTELPVSVTIAMGFPKGDKLEFLAQKVTELGANALWSYPADWSVAKWDTKKLTKKSEKLSKICQGAAEQSKRHRIPNIRLFESKKDFLETFSQFDYILIAYEESAKKYEQSAFSNFLSQLKANTNILCIFGPEGGISPKEIDTYENLGAITVGLGPRIMRTETAPLYLLSSMSYVLELKDKLQK